MILTILNNNTNMQDLNIERVLEKTLKDDEAMTNKILSKMKQSKRDHAYDMKLEDEVCD